MIKNCIISFVCTLFVCHTATAQSTGRFNSFTYNVNEGLLQSHVLDMAFDSNNFGWLSFSNGIQKFDGNRFKTVPVQQGLPDDKMVNFFTTSSGDLLIAHAKGISKYDLLRDRFFQVYNNETTDNVPVIFLGEDDGFVCFLTATGNIKSIDAKTFTNTSTTKFVSINLSAEQPGRLKITGNIINHRIGIQTDSGFYLWDLKAHHLVSKVSQHITAEILWLNNENEAFLLADERKGLIKSYNFITGEQKAVNSLPADPSYNRHGHLFSWQQELFAAVGSSVYKTNDKLSSFSERLLNYQNQSIGGTASIDKIRQDRFGNLYLLTVNDGIRKIISSTYPIKYFGVEKSDQNFILSICADKKNNRILTGTSGHGLFVYDTLQRLIKHVEFLPGENTPFTASCIVSRNDGSYLVFCVGKTVVWQLSRDLKTFTIQKVVQANEGPPVEIDYGNPISISPGHTWVHTRGSIYTIDPLNKQIRVFSIPGIKSFGCTLYKDKLILHANDLLYYIDTVSFKVQQTISLKNTAGVRCFAADASGNIYAGSNKGIFKIDAGGNVLAQLKKENGLPDECINSMLFDLSGTLWCGTNKGLIKLKNDNLLLQLKKDDGLQANQFVSNVAAITTNGELFFGGVNGVSSFYPSTISPAQEKINMLFTSIKINNTDLSRDSSTQAIRSLDLPFNQNYLAFDFIAMAGNNPAQYIHQYKMEGVDDQWIQNVDLQTVRYYLPPGKYVFKVTAGRFFDKDAKPLKEIIIVIHPPFWRTWWFLFGFAALFILVAVFAVNRYNKRKYSKKLAELEGEHKIQLERERISRDLHDSIGAYANAVLYKTDLLQKQKSLEESSGLMKDLKFASKDIITSLRETVWALKKDKYTAQECVLRIRNFVQPFNRYYDQIHFTVTGDAPAAMELHYTRALNLVRIVQEAVSNSIKHSDAKNVNVQSSIVPEGWKLVVTDDGKGFDFASADELQHGNGLNNMRKRSADAGFQLTTDAVAGKGTSISILVT